MKSMSKRALVAIAAVATIGLTAAVFADSFPTVTNQSGSNSNAVITTTATGFPSTLVPGQTGSYTQPSSGTDVRYENKANPSQNCNFFFETGPKGQLTVVRKIASGKAQCEAHGLHLGVSITS